MHKTIRVLDLERSLRAVLEDVVNEHVPYVLTEDSHPEAVLVPYEEFLKLQRFKEDDVLARFDETWTRLGERNALISEDEVAADIAAARGGRLD
ncbi:MAG TPA: type II toxin-antitoxin system prevent-host-death family antitoxin [Thermoanaerobaculia bacterium]|nr:type II toxin-antitoxin system prevent-host-death family antitoxin [Thermoanaerobaculia bacterium]